MHASWRRRFGASWRRRRWALYAPLYGLVTPALRGRRRSLELLDLRAGQRVLVVGCGTGEDLPLLPAGVEIVATDLVPAMLARARERGRPGTEYLVMDAEHLEFPDASFDAVILHLVLAVVDEPERCLAEAGRVVRPGGFIAVFDKFADDHGAPGLVRRALNPIARVVATDLTRRLGDLIVGSRAPLEVVAERSAGFHGLLRAVLLRRVPEVSS